MTTIQHSHPVYRATFEGAGIAGSTTCRHEDLRTFDAIEFGTPERQVICADCQATLLHMMVVPGSEP